MNAISITNGDQHGQIEYDQDTMAFTITFPDQDIRAKIERHLTTRRVFRIPRSQIIDDYEEIEATPTDQEDYFLLTLCTLAAETGVKLG